MLQGTVDQKIKRVSIWFYVIAAFQFFAAYVMWNRSQGESSVAQGAMLLAAADVAIGLLFVLFGFFAAKKQPWAFVAGLILYGLRAVLQFFAFFSPVALIIRAYLMFRMYQGLQACLAARQAVLLTRMQSKPRRLEVPHMPVSSPAPAWTPARPTSASVEDRPQSQ